MPNTEVKHFNGEDSWACPCENSKLPVFLMPDRLWTVFSFFTDSQNHMKNTDGIL